ncbi:MAG: transcriptional regulator NrdR [Alphaproteobacteria bacterium]|jgi:transcriptional repressor NrdR|nr:transcriptional regulator NrdR [Alphaproteobacteria bacterium]MDP7222807.1 transcriptional regulator NrdR [Alphaproteobacteria bacterium]
MRCPFCDSQETQVKDSRPAEDNSAIRRRRICPECGGRFTTFERIQLREMTVFKAGNRRQPFDRDKLIKSMQIALRKRPVELEEIEKVANSIVRQLESAGDAEINTDLIGSLVMKALARLDAIGYIRYASVYKDFRKPEDFNFFLEELQDIHLAQKDKKEKED